MAFGNFFNGGAAYGIADMENHADQRRTRGIINEQMASQVRNQQETEAMERDARRKMDTMQTPGVQPLPQGYAAGEVPAQAAPVAPQGRSAPATTGRAQAPVQKSAPQATAFDVDGAIQTYQSQLDGVNSNIAAIDKSRAPQPAGPTVDDGAGGVYTPETGRKFTMSPEDSAQYKTLQQQQAGYKQGLDQLQKLKGQDAKSRHAAILDASPSIQQGNKVDMAAAAPFLANVATQRGIPPEILQRVLAVESGGVARPNAQGSSANGFFQFIPETAKRYGVQVGDFRSEADGAARYLADLNKQFGGDWNKTLAAYGGGFVNGQITPNGQKYVAQYQGALGGQGGQQVAAAPQVPGQPGQQQPFNPQGGTQLMGGQNIDQSLQQQAQMVKLLQMQAQGTHDLAKRAELTMKSQMLQYGMQDTQIKQLAHQAQFNPQAMQQLVSLFAGQAGAQLGIQNDGQGNVRLVGANGQPVPGQWGQPMPVANLIQSMHQNLSQGLSAAQAQLSSVYQQELAKSSGEAAGKTPGKLAELRQMGANNAAAHEISGNMEIQKMLMEHGIKQTDVKGVTYSPSGDNSYVVHTNQGAFQVAPGGVDPKTKMKIEPSVSPVNISGGAPVAGLHTNGPMITGSAPRG